MAKHYRISIVFLLFFSIIFLSYSIKRSSFLENRKESELLYFPSSNTVKPFLMEYALPFTDYLWFQGIQYYGGHVEDRDLKYVDKVFTVLTDIDPKFVNAYTFGSLILLYDLKRSDDVFRFLLKGWQNNPEEWYIPYTMGFFNYVYFKDYRKAARFFHLAASLPDAPDFVKKFEIFCYQTGGEYKNAFYMWRQLYENSPNKLEKMVALKNILTISAGYYYCVEGITSGYLQLFDDNYLLIGEDSAKIINNNKVLLSLPKNRIKMLGKKWFKGDKNEENCNN